MNSCPRSRLACRSLAVLLLSTLSVAAQAQHAPPPSIYPSPSPPPVYRPYPTQPPSPLPVYRPYPTQPPDGSKGSWILVAIAVGTVIAVSAAIQKLLNRDRKLGRLRFKGYPDRGSQEIEGKWLGMKGRVVSVRVQPDRASKRLFSLNR